MFLVTRYSGKIRLPTLPASIHNLIIHMMTSKMKYASDMQGGI
jgi:hypothetical protein